MVDLNFFMVVGLWAVVPGAVTNLLLGLVYRFVLKGQSLDVVKRTDPMRFNKHYRWMFTLVVSGYLLYTVVHAERGLPLNHYQHLNLRPDEFDLRDLRSNYRSLSLQFHPDKNQANAARYLHIRDAYEVLKDPIRKTAYDRYGPAGADCSHCKTERDYLYNGLSQMIGYYIGTGVMLLFFSLTNQDFGRYWKLVLLVAVAATEWGAILTPIDSMERVLWWRPPFERVIVLHQVYISVSIALSQIGPIWWPQQRPSSAILTDIENMTNVLDQDTRADLKAFTDPFSNDPKELELLRTRLATTYTDLRVIELHAKINAATSG